MKPNTPPPPPKKNKEREKSHTLQINYLRKKEEIVDSKKSAREKEEKTAKPPGCEPRSLSHKLKLNDGQIRPSFNLSCAP